METDRSQLENGTLVRSKYDQYASVSGRSIEIKRGTMGIIVNKNLGQSYDQTLNFKVRVAWEVEGNGTVNHDTYKNDLEIVT